MSQLVTDASGQEHEFPDEATPEMIAQALGIAPPKKSTFLEDLGNRYIRNWKSAGRVLGAAGQGAIAPFTEGGPLGPSPEFMAQHASNQPPGLKQLNTAGYTLGGTALDILGRAVQAPTEAVARGGGQLIEEVGGLQAGVSAGTENRQFQREIRALANAAGFVAGGSPAIAAPFRGSLPKTAAPTTEALKTQAKAAYKTTAGENLVISQSSMAKFADELSDTLKDEGIDATLHPGAMAALNRIASATNADIAFKDFEILRRVANGAKKSFQNPDQQRIAEIITDKMDDFLEGLGKNDTVSGNARVTSDAVKSARELWTRHRKAEVIEEALEKAGLNASATFSGGNIENSVRQQFKQLLTKKSVAKRWTEAERALIKGVVSGGPIGNVARLIGKLSPEGSGLMAIMQIGGVAASGGASLPLPLLGMAAKRFADSRTRKRALNVLNKVQAGSANKSFQLKSSAGATTAIGAGKGLGFDNRGLE